MRNKNSTSFIKSELFIIIIKNFNNFDFHANLAINYSTKWNFLLAKKNVVRSDVTKCLANIVVYKWLLHHYRYYI